MGGSWIITADHGNAETMIDPSQKARTRITRPIRCPLFMSARTDTPLRPNGALQDISPTILGILKIEQPKEMKGHDLRVV